MEILLVVAVGAMCIGCFLVGAKVGQTVSKGEKIELPTVNPIEAVPNAEYSTIINWTLSNGPQ